MAAGTITNSAQVGAQPTNAPTNKVWAATGGSAIGTPLGTVLVYFLEQVAGPMPDNVKTALVAVFATVATLALGWVVPPGKCETVVQTQDGAKTARIA